MRSTERQGRASANGPAGAPPDVRYTVMVVPEGGRGEVWQVQVPLRRVRQAVGVATTLVVALLALAGVQAATLPRVVAHDSLVGENLALKARLDEVDRRIAELEPLVARVRTYDEQLRALEARQELPGFGPVDADELAARQAWIDGVVSDVPRGARRAGEVEANLAALEDELASLSGGLETFQERLDAYTGFESALPKVWPLENAVLTSPYGYRIQPFTRRWKFHTGLDLGAPIGTPIFATSDGLVSFTGWDSGHGLSVIVDHGQDVTTHYFHASRVLVDEGDQVAAGDIIALVGSTGMSTGPHLHFELLIDGEKVDPLEYLP